MNSSKPSPRTRRIASPPVPPPAGIKRQAKTPAAGPQRERGEVLDRCSGRAPIHATNQISGTGCRTSHSRPAQATDPWPWGPALEFRRLLRALSGLPLVLFDRVDRRVTPTWGSPWDRRSWRCNPATSTEYLASPAEKFRAGMSEKGLIRTREFIKVTCTKAPRLKVQAPSGREGESPVWGLVSGV